MVAKPTEKLPFGKKNFLSPLAIADQAEGEAEGESEGREPPSQ